MGAKATALVRDRGRVTGVRVAHNGSEQALGARLVVGADGRNSTVARLAGSRKYNLTPNERFFSWSFFEDADPGAEPTVIFHRWSGTFVVAIPADSGLYQVLAIPELSELPRFRQGLEESYLEYVCRCDPVAQALSGARRIGKLFGILRWEGFFREATGPGWVLAGDPGHFKDPAPGQGIQDAFRQVEFLAPAIIGAINGSPSALDEALAGWARWRDDDAGDTTGSPPTSAGRAWRPRCCRRSHSVCTSGASWTRSRTCSTTAPFPRRCCRLLGCWPRQPGCWRAAVATGERCWARWVASSPRTPGGNAWPGIRTMSRSRRPWTPGRLRSKTTMLSV